MLLAVGALALPRPAASAAGEGLEILGRGWPRAFFFRASEAMARSGRTPFDEWEKAFLPLNGIMGKVLDEELVNTSAANIPFFTRYKAEHPEKMVLLHFNGDARDPRWEASGFFAGHWLYHAGCRVTGSVSARAGEDTLTVANPSLFHINIGRFADANEELGLCLLGPDGKPDWRQSEQLELLAVDAAAGTLRVRRGAFGTAPRAFPAGKVYVAAHAVEGPWGRTSHLLWRYNYSTACPRDAQGRNCVDVLVEDVARRFLPGGALAGFDGLEFDVLFYDAPGAVDADGDGKADGGIVAGVNTYGIGVYDFCRRLREKLGPDRLILADGQSPSNQRCFGILNGIESEGWPTLSDPEIVDWSGGLNRHNFWQENAHPPALSYINHKFVSPSRTPGRTETAVQVPFSTSRLVMAAGLFSDSAITYSLAPPAEDGERVGIYDELRMGTAHRTNWLGRPLAPPVPLGLRSPDLLAGDGVRWPDRLLRRLEMEDTVAKRAEDGRSLLLTAASPAADHLAFTLPGVRLPAGDLLLHLRLKAAPMKGYPAGIARAAWVGWQAPGDLLAGRPLATGMALRGRTEEAIRPETGAVVRATPAAEVAGETHRAYFVHPPWIGGTGCTFWEVMAAIPPGRPRLSFFTALSDRARAQSDGVVMTVQVHDGRELKTVAAFLHRERRWVARSADLSPWAGRRVRLRFTTDAGPADNSTADQSYWGDVRIEGGEGEVPPPERLALTPRRVMTWANGRWFDASFYFRNLGPASVDLTFECEGGEPVALAELTAHAAADAVAREYEHGVVLANPSTRPYLFNVASLFPGAKLRRLQGSPHQDPTTNDGSPVGNSVTVGPRDALFLTRE